MTGVPAPAGWRACTAYDCVALGLPRHDHVMVPFRTQPDRRRNPYAATHFESQDIDRVWVDWRAVAYEAWTGRQLPPPDGQLTLELEAHGG